MTTADVEPCPYSLCSDHTEYRYHWPKELGGGGDRLLFVMKNPSCPDSECNTTFRQILTRAKSLGAQSLDVVNLFARRTGKRAQLLNDFSYADAVGPENDESVLSAASGAERIIVAWGGHSHIKHYDKRVGEVLELLEPWDLYVVEHPQPKLSPLHPMVWSPRYPLVLWRKATGGR